MMVLEVDVRPGLSDAFGVTVEVGALAWRVALRWAPALAAWVYRIETPEGDPLGLWWRVAPGGTVPLDRRDPRVPPGLLRWEGPDPYERDDLGTQVLLLYEVPE